MNKFVSVSSLILFVFCCSLCRRNWQYYPQQTECGSLPEICVSLLMFIIVDFCFALCERACVRYVICTMNFMINNQIDSLLMHFVVRASEFFPPFNSLSLAFCSTQNLFAILLLNLWWFSILMLCFFFHFVFFSIFFFFSFAIFLFHARLCHIIPPNI